MNKENIKYIILCALTLLFSLCYLFRIISYETNDDSLMNMIASGYWLGEPSQYLIQINVILSKILVFLYTHFPGFNWYFLMLFGTQFIAWNLILNVLIKKTSLHQHLETSLIPMAILGSIELLFIIPLLLKIQFTSTAFLIGFAGILTLWKTETWTIRQVSIVFFCIVMAGLLRFQVGLFVLGTSLFFVDYQQVIRHFSVIAATIVAIAFFKLVHTSSYNAVSPKFESWQQANEQIMNNPNYNDTVSLAKADLSDTDWNIFKSWFWLDTLVFNKEKIINAAATLKRSATALEIMKRGGRFLMDQTLPLIFLMLLFSIFQKQNKSKQLKIRSLSFFIFIGILLFYLILFQRIPTRVTTPICLILIFYLVLNIDYQYITQKNFKNKLKIFGGILAITMLGQSLDIWSIINKNINYRASFTAHQTLFSAHHDKLFLGLGSAVPMEGMPVELNPISYSSFNFLALGWSEFTPPQEAFLKKWHITHLPFELLTNDIYIVGHQADFDTNLKAFYEAHYNRKITFLKENMTTNDIFIQQLKAAE